jgi:hypothetical protein
LGLRTGQHKFLIGKRPDQLWTSHCPNESKDGTYYDEI